MYKDSGLNFSKGILFAIVAPVFLLAMGIALPHAFADQVVGSIPVGTTPDGVAVNPVTNEIYVTNAGSDDMSVINGTSDSLITTVPLGSAPFGVAVNPVTNMVYVTAYKVNLDIINGSTNTVQQTVPLRCECDAGARVNGVSVNSQTNMIYVTMLDTEHLGTQLDNGGSVIAVNGATGAQAAEISGLAGWPAGISVNEATNMVYATTLQGNYQAYLQNHYVYVIDGSTNSNVTRILVPNTPNTIATDPETNMVYVTEGTGGTLAVIDGSSNTLGDTVTVGSSPNGVGVNPDTDIIYVANHDNNTVSIIDGSSDQVSDTLSVGSAPGAIAINPNTSRAYVVNSGDNTVSVIQGSPKTTSQLQVISQDSFGNAITGFYTELYADNGAQLDTGYTPYAFTLVNGQNYAVHVENYGTYKFNHWADTGSTNASRAISVSSDQSITAVYATIPTHPTNLTATAVSSSQIDLSWNAPASDGGSPITGYRIQQSTDDSTWTTIVKNTGNTSTAYNDTGLSDNTTYYYRVFALNSVGSSYRSNIASATTPILSVAGTNIGPVTTTLP